jgi:hypothetical protein
MFEYGIEMDELEMFGNPNIKDVRLVEIDKHCKL